MIVIIANISGENINILDAGCGEGYFLSRLKEAIYANKSNSILSKQYNFFGVDISKSAVNYAVKRDKKINFIVSSNFNLPIMPNTMDVIIRNFAPSDTAELKRVLKDNGRLVVVTPGIRTFIWLKRDSICKCKKTRGKRNDF